MDAELGGRRGCWIECLTEMLDLVSDRDAGLSADICLSKE